MGETAAIQVTIALSTIPSLILVRRCLDAADPTLLTHLLGAAAAGLALGALVFATATVDDLKWGAAAAVLAMAVLSTRIHERRIPVRQSGVTGRLLTGLMSGAMTATLAMPGPAIAAWAQVSGLDKARTRATLLVVALVCYPAALVLHGVVDGVSHRVVDEFLWLAAPVVAGTLFGQVIAGRIPDSGLPLAHHGAAPRRRRRPDALLTLERDRDCYPPMALGIGSGPRPSPDRVVKLAHPGGLEPPTS